MLQLVNLALKFILELCALACVAYWGFQQSDQLPPRVLFGAAAAVLFAIGWGVFLAPTAHSGLDLVSKNIVGGAVLLLAAVALAATGQRTPALVYAVAIIINAALLFAFRDQPVPSVIAGPRA